MKMDNRKASRIQILGGPKDGDYHYVTDVMRQAGVVVQVGRETYIVIEMADNSHRLQYVIPERANGG